MFSDAILKIYVVSNKEYGKSFSEKLWVFVYHDDIDFLSHPGHIKVSQFVVRSFLQNVHVQKKMFAS